MTAGEPYGQPAPTVCPTCGNNSVYVKSDMADMGRGQGWVAIKFCVVCQKRVTE